MIRQRGGFRGSWDIAMMFALLWILVMEPYRIGFDVELEVASFMYWFERAIDVFFIVDIFLNFRTTFYDAATNNEVFDRRRCAMNYLKSWFVLDMAASIPVELIAQIKGLSSGTGGGDTSFAGLSAQEVKALKLLKLGKLIRAVRMIRLAQTGKFALLQEKIEDESIRYGLDNVIRQTMALSSLIFLLLYVSHLFACIFVFIADHELGAVNWYHNQGLCVHDATATCYRDLYTTSLYWAIMTMTTVGYGDIYPTNDGEKIFVMVAMMFGGAYFAYMIALMVDVVTKKDANQNLFNERIDGVRSYCNAQDLPRNLQLRVVKYYKHLLRTKSAFDEGKLLYDLSPSLRNEIAVRLASDVIFRVPFFKWVCDEGYYIAKLVVLSRPVLALKGDEVISSGDARRTFEERSSTLNPLHVTAMARGSLTVA